MLSSNFTFYRKVGVFIVFILCMVNSLHSQSLTINEIMAANSSTIKDPQFQEYADWFEIYNNGSVPVNLKNMYVSDNFAQPLKFKITVDAIVAPGAYLLIWADDHAIGLHANFKLSASGEKVGIFDSVGRLIDTMSFGSQQDDISYGRFPDASTSLFFFSPTTPGKQNLASGIYNRVAQPVVSLNAGFYSSPVSVSITHPDPNAIVTFTVNGRNPTPTGTRYIAPISIDSTTVLKVAAFKEGYVPSKIVFRSYFINENTTLPVFSLSTDPDNLFSDTSGIYVIGTNGVTGYCSTAPRNWNQDWERPMDIEFFEKNRSTGFTASAGVKIYGGCTRLYDMKSLAFYFRDEYGYGKLNYKLFPNLPYTSYNNFILRSSGQDWYRTLFRDAMIHTLISRNPGNSVQAYRASVVFINGRYWGIHNIREKINEHYIGNHFAVEPDSVDLIEVGKSAATAGNITAYNQMYSFVSANDLSVSANYAYMKSIFDIENYIDYTTQEIYAANGDWPGGNSKLWKERSGTGKWRWLFYDMDYGFGGNSAGQYNTNTLASATASTGTVAKATLILRKLLENPSFKHLFIQRLAAHANTTFRKDYVHKVIDSLSSIIAPEISRHKARWAKSVSMGNDWTVNINVMKDFAVNRPGALRGFVYAKFGISSSYAITFSGANEGRGIVYAAGLPILQDSVQQIFYKEIPLSLRAVPLPGYRFVRWEGLFNSTQSDTMYVGTVTGSLRAVFEPANGIEKDNIPQPGIALYQNYPNPFNPVTRVGFTITKCANAVLRLYSTLGEIVQEIALHGLASGYHEIEIRAENLPSGMYFYEIQAGEFKAVKKCMLIK